MRLVFVFYLSGFLVVLVYILVSDIMIDNILINCLFLDSKRKQFGEKNSIDFFSLVRLTGNERRLGFCIFCGSRFVIYCLITIII